MAKYIFVLITLFSFLSCQQTAKDNTPSTPKTKTGIELIVLGTVQDAGSPHAGCKKDCCKDLFKMPDANRMVVSLGIIDHDLKKTYLLEASPDLPRQMELLLQAADLPDKKTVDGIFITHAHIGHYTGLMYLGRESLGSKAVRVFTMPKMSNYLQNNGPWDQLVNLENIKLHPLRHDSSILISPQLSVTPFLVPHRDEYSETIGFRLSGPTKTVLFISDINKWNIWDQDIRTEIFKVDYVFLDGTFYNNSEIPNRDMSEIPHPFVVESMELFRHLPNEEKNKIYFIHLNHTNPLLNPQSKEYQEVIDRGFHVAEYGLRVVM